MATDRLHHKRWVWEISSYYKDTVQPPKVAGALALRTVHSDDQSKDTEMNVYAGRDDIGDVYVRHLHDNAKSYKVDYS